MRCRSAAVPRRPPRVLLRHAVVRKRSDRFCSGSLSRKVSVSSPLRSISYDSSPRVARSDWAHLQHLSHLPERLAAPWAEPKGKQGTAQGSKVGCEMADVGGLGAMLGACLSLLTARNLSRAPFSSLPLPQVPPPALTCSTAQT